LEVGARDAAHHPIGDPELAGLLLRERARPVARAERAPGCGRVRAGQVVALAAAAVIEDRVAAMAIAHRREPRGDLADRGVPVDRLERAVGAPPQRLGDAVAAVLVVVEAMRLLACIAARRGMALVAADPDQVVALELDLEAAVALAEDARRALPAISHAPSLDNLVVSCNQITCATASAATTARSLARSRSSATGGRCWSCARPSSASAGSPTSRPTCRSRATSWRRGSTTSSSTACWPASTPA